MSQADPPPGPGPGPLILLCFAVPEEARFVSNLHRSGDRIRVLVTGVGSARAARALNDALRQQVPALVLTCGFAGGLRPGLACGTVVCSDDDEAGLAAAFSALGAVPVTFHCSPRIAITALEKRRLHAETGADAVEMESGMIRQICRDHQIPSATLRVISDSAEQDLPLDFNTLLNERGRLRLGRLVVALLRSPAKVAGLLRLQRQTRLAARNLARALQALLQRGLG
jgi:adenosylhomocysteine nucleosidase